MAVERGLVAHTGTVRAGDAPERRRPPGPEADATATVEGADVTVDDRTDEASAAADPLSVLARTPLLGRYLVLERLGAGGMAVVASAYDSRLDRKVAVKLVHPRMNALNGRARMLKEAQSLAQLAHPNVVAVYDVGTHDEHVVLAMELVQGRTLRQWLLEGPHPWRTVLDRFVRAGRGLAAAHAAGIVHRDFKPDNVLVGDDGRVLVADFGLATARGISQPPIPGARSSSLLDVQLTANGTVVGTPAYMAPEQRSGLPVDARVDQFSFCVALHEALFGERMRFDPHAQRVLTPVRSDLGPALGAPAWLRRVLARGLAIAPSGRWPSMEALLTALGEHTTPRRRWAGVALSACIVAGGALGWPHDGDADEVGRCARASTAAAELWSSETRGRIERAMTRTGVAHARHTWRHVESNLHAYVQGWTRMHESTCTSGDPIAGERTRTCLARRRVALQSTIDVLAEADATAVERAARVVAALPALDDCVDPERATLPVPDDPRTAAEVEAIRERLQHAHALGQAGRYGEGIAIARAQIDLAELTGHMPLQAEAQLQLGALLELGGDAKAAEDHLLRAVWLARESGHDVPAALAMIRLMGAVGYHQARVEDGLAWWRHAEAAAERARLDRRHVAWMRNAAASVLYRAGDYDGAGAIYEQNLELLAEPQNDAERQELAGALNNLGNVEARRNRMDGSTQALERAVEVMTELLGPEHPTVAITIANLGNMRFDLGELEVANEHLQRALRILRASVPDDHPAIASLLGNLGLVQERLGRAQDGRRSLEESTALKRRRLGDDHPDVAHSLNNLGEVVRGQGDAAAAAEYHAEAVEIWRRKDPEHPYASFPLANLGVDLLELGRTDEALVHLRAAAAICATKQVDPTIMATTKFGLARATWSDPRSRAEALRLAREAEAGYAAIGGRYRFERDRVRAWLAEHE